QSGQYLYPLFPSEPVPGYPGVGADEDHTLEKLTDYSKPKDPKPGIYGHPEFLAYPGAVHHLRYFLQRYLPLLPLYNQHTLHKNFILHQMPEYAGRCTEFAEPVYYNPMYGRRSPTKQRRPAVKVLPFKRGDTIKMTIGKLDRSIYMLRPIVAAPGVKTVEEHKLLMFKLLINDQDDPAQMSTYILRAPCLDNFYAVTDFAFRSLGDGRTFRAELSLLAESEVDTVLYNIDVHDRFAELARRRGKKRTIEGAWLPTDTSKWPAMWEKNRKEHERQYSDWTKDRHAKRTPEEQKAYDDLIWEFMTTPINQHTAGWTWYLQKTDWTAMRLIPVPDDQKERLAPFREFADAAEKKEGMYKYLGFRARYPYLNLTEGKAWLDGHNLFHDRAPAYQLKEVGVFAPGSWTTKQVDGKPKRIYVPGEKLGVSSDFSFSGNTAYVKGKKVDLRQLRFRGKLFIDGKPADNEIVETATVSTGWEYFDKDLRVGMKRVFDVKPGLYYDANLITWGSGVTSMNHGRYFHGIVPWVKFGIEQNVRDEAMKFVQYAYNIPVNNPSQTLAYVAGFEGLDRGLLKMLGSGGTPTAVRFYDVIYPFLHENEEFAQAVGRYIPWIKTSDDLITMLDTYVIQDYANCIMKSRSFTDHEQSKMMMTCVLAQDDTSISDPWMEFLFTRGWEYPQALSGFADNIITGTTRDGGTTIGSYMYGLGGGMAALEMLGKYMKNGGNPKYDITDPRQCPSTRQKGYFVLEGSAAGRVNPGIGDVGGPAERYGRMTNMSSVKKIHEAAWRWTKDPKFAWELVNTWNRSGQTDEEWAEIETAAKTVPRDPFLMNKSRILSDWNGFLTLNKGVGVTALAGSDIGHGDPRLIREVAIRVGTGWGHEHYDTLDLRLFAFGLTMSGDFNQRKAYGRPAHSMTITHNLVLVDRKNWMGHAWIGDLFDAPGSPYLTAESVAPYEVPGVKLYRRQVAMVECSSGLQAGDVSSQYVFDVFRVSGGGEHAYAFHGCVDDGFEANVKNKQMVEGGKNSPDNGFLSSFRPERKSTKLDARSIGAWSLKTPPEYWVADPDGDHLVATWNLDPKAEKLMARSFDVFPGEKFTRLTMLNPDDSRIMHGIARSSNYEAYYGRCLFVVKGKPNIASPDMNTGAENLLDDEGTAAQKSPAKAGTPTSTESVFVSLIEPYAGEPSITSQRELTVADNETDARRAVAVEVKTKHGRTDLLFADGRTGKTRKVSGVSVQVSGEYAYVSTDQQGLRQATLTGGTLLETQDLKIEVETARYGATVTKVNYLDRIVTLKGKIPERLAGHYFEVGNDLHKTSYEVSTIKNRLFGKTELTLRKGMEIMRTRVRSADPKTGKVKGAIAMMHLRGRDSGLVASNDALTNFWRVEYTGGNRHYGHNFNLTPMDPDSQAPAFAAADFPAGEGIRIWEFGVGDTFSIQTGASLQRTGENKYAVYATSPFKLTIGGKSHNITEKRLAAGNRIFLRVQ
ncbi:MAG: hypothetical protein QGG53_09735, partial [Planctomycetota bacterium]|nr:hypothetical protein [Planctomycetota bacterium]